MKKYNDTWESLDTRSTPEWFKQAKFGIFIHWGIYSVPAFAPRRFEVNDTGSAYGEWYGWFVREKRERFVRYHKNNYGDAPYEALAEKFKGEKFDADEWAELFRKSGAKYILAVSKHHDGYTLFDSPYSKGWNSLQVGLKRDVIKELFEACDRNGLIRGAYYSLMEWPHPVFTGEEMNAVTAEKYALNKMIPEMKELICRYRPQILYADGEWGFPSSVWHSENFLQWLYNESPVRDTIVVNDRWGSDCRGIHGGYKTCEYGEVNSAAISEELARENLGKYYWEESRSIGNSFGYNANETAEDYLGDGELLKLLVGTVADGGNLCLNVGPCADGTILPLMKERLSSLGKWLEINGEAIYGTVGGGEQNGVYLTKKAGIRYYILFGKPQGNARIPIEKKVGSVTLLGFGKVGHYTENNGLTVTLPVGAKLPGEAYVLKVEE